MAIEKVWIENNTSIMQDEVLSHRLGLIPLWVKPEALAQFDYNVGQPTDRTTLVFKLHVTCKRNPDAKDDDRPEDKYIGSKIYSSDLVWIPQGNQEEWFGNDPPRPTVPDILIMKLRPGQEISLVVHCHKGIGSTHAKWSPVCTASYRLMPDITFKTKIDGADAKKLKKTCPLGVFDIEDGVATVANARKCTMCRECIRDPKFTDTINLGKLKDHYICK
jgi:DNA-directed RNA polymerase I and III subunit RPAC1